MSRTISRSSRKASANGRVRYAVVGLGWIAQESVLPAYAHAPNSKLAALVSDDPAKLKALGSKYGVTNLYSYEEYDACLQTVDAVYIALPNHLHCEYAVRAAYAGVHVLCEKPMAVTEQECLQMLHAASTHGVKMMIAYRLHFEQMNLEALKLARSKKLGDVRLFSSVFAMPVEDKNNIRLDPLHEGGGTLYDIGIYCINNARAVFGAEPQEVYASSVQGHSKRFDDSDEMTSAILCFPGNRMASFTTSFSVNPVSMAVIAGTKGMLRLDPAYKHSGRLKRYLTLGEKKESPKTYPDRDQFAPELIYFSDCVKKNREPQPSGMEGLADVRVIRALLESARTGRPVRLPAFDTGERPSISKEKRLPAAEKPRLVHAEAP